MAEVIWTEPALAHLKAIVDFIAEDSPAYAGRLAHSLVVAPRRLQLFPQLGRMVPGFDRPNFRELIHGA